jgi:hypothetical protein
LALRTNWLNKQVIRMGDMCLTYPANLPIGEKSQKYRHVNADRLRLLKPEPEPGPGRTAALQTSGTMILFQRPRMDCTSPSTKIPERRIPVSTLLMFTGGV